MRILFVIPYYVTFGGPAHVVREVARHLVRRGHKVTVHTTDAAGGPQRATIPTDDEGVRLRVFPNLSADLAWRKKGFLPLAYRAAAVREVADFDVVHVIEPRHVMAIWALRAARRAGVPTILSPHGSFLNVMQSERLKAAFDALWGRRALRQYDRFHALTDAERGQIESVLGPRPDVAVIPNGIDPPPVPTAAERRLARQTLEVADGEFVALYLGRFHHFKGLDTLLRAARRVADARASFRLWLAGPDDGHLAATHALADELRLNDVTRFLGFVSGEEKRRVLAAADAFTLLSRQEAMPVTVLEALAHALPVIVSTPAAVDGLAAADAGRVVEIGDETGAADALLALVDSPDRAAWGQRGRALVEARYTWETIVSRYEDLYRSVARR